MHVSATVKMDKICFIFVSRVCGHCLHSHFGVDLHECKVTKNIQDVLPVLLTHCLKNSYLCSMTRHFNTHIEDIDLKFWHGLIKNRGKLVRFNTGEYMCRAGKHVSLFGYVKSGYFRYEAEGFDGKIKIGGFAFKDALIGDFPFCLRSEPAHFDITACRKSEVWLMDGTVLKEICENDDYAGKQWGILMESSYRSLLRRHCSFLCRSAAGRYMELVEEHPQIEQDVPQKDIAAYLQISPQYLCRLRKARLVSRGN